MIPAAPAPARHTARRGGRHRAGRRLTAALPGVSLAGPAAVALALLLALPGAQAPVDRVAAATSAPPLQIHAGAPDVPEADAGEQVRQAPVRLRIPSLGVDSPLVRLGLDRDGALLPPTDFARAGWFAGSPVPGDVGPAVIAGHVDSVDGPAVFFRLRELDPGDEVLVDLDGGTTVRFVVSGSRTHPKDRFPTGHVYGPTSRAELRLITCGGEFDRDRRSYRDNVVVNAVRAP